MKNAENMNIKYQLIIFVAFLVLGISFSYAQSLKEIVDDSTGKYIYAQARDNDPTAAIELAEDELDSRVESYLGENGISDYNHNWKEWIKRIVNEKFGLTRAFLYLNVDDLKPGAIQMSETKRDYLGKTKSESSPVINSEVVSTNDTESTMKSDDDILSSNDVEKNDVENRIVEDTDVEKIDLSSSEDTNQGVEISDISVNSLSDDFMDFINRILALKNPGSVSSELTRAKNLNLISIFGNSNSKYIPRAYIVVMNNSNIEVYAPEGDGGKRMNMKSGNPGESSSAKLIYWFLKKSK